MNLMVVNDWKRKTPLHYLTLFLSSEWKYIRYVTLDVTYTDVKNNNSIYFVPAAKK